MCFLADQLQYDNAKNAYRRVLDRDPSHAKVLQQLGWLHHQQSNSFSSQEQAIEYLEKSVSSGETLQTDMSYIAHANTWQIKVMRKAGICLDGATCHSRNTQKHTRPISKQFIETVGTRHSGARLAFCIIRSTSTEMHLTHIPAPYA
jgi:tetratricopeptide (TPR) repeat protein